MASWTSYDNAGAAGSHDGDVPGGDAPTMALVESVARHFPGGIVEGTTVRTGLGERTGAGSGIAIAAHAEPPQSLGPSLTTIPLYFWLSGATLGPDPIFASISGYGATAQEAIWSGGCAWCCTASPLLQAAVGYDLPQEFGGCDRRIEVAGRSYRLVADCIDRGMDLGGLTGQWPDHFARLRMALAGELSLSPHVVASGLLPPPASDRVTVVSTFVMDLPTGRTVEIKSNGVDIEAAATQLFREPAPDAHGVGLLLRELAVLIPDPMPA